MTYNKYTNSINELVDTSIRYKVSFVLTQFILNELTTLMEFIKRLNYPPSHELVIR